MRDIWLILHFVSLGIGMGASTTMLILAIRTRKLPAAERAGIMNGVGILRLVGPFGLLLLIVSGFGLVLPMGASIWHSGLFQTKMALVLGLLAWVIYGQVRAAIARRTGQPPAPLPLALVGLPVALVTTVVIIAVLLFH